MSGFVPLLAAVAAEFVVGPEMLDELDDEPVVDDDADADIGHEQYWDMVTVLLFVVVVILDDLFAASLFLSII